jgi:hypothetical protein
MIMDISIRNPVRRATSKRHRGADDATAVERFFESNELLATPGNWATPGLMGFPSPDRRIARAMSGPFLLTACRTLGHSPMRRGFHA